MKKQEAEQISLDGILRRLRHLPKTIECGMHSGIPECCVRFYATLWMFASSDSEFRRKHREINGHPGYIRCPECCRSGKLVAVKACPKGSHCWHSEECAT